MNKLPELNVRLAKQLAAGRGLQSVVELIDELVSTITETTARIAQLECAVEDASRDGEMLDRIEAGEWNVLPLVGGGWAIERSVGSSLTDYSEERLAHHRGALRDALYLANKAVPIPSSAR